jgi:hypothetical protein
MIYPDSDSGLRAAGEIPIYDMKGMTLRHITKTVLTTLRTYMKFTQVGLAFILFFILPDCYLFFIL